MRGATAVYFHLIFENVTLVTSNSAGDILESILRIDPGDVLVGISFPRYSKRTVQAAHYARANGAKVIALTDTGKAPIADAAHFLLMARSDMISFVDSLVAPLSMVNALIVAVGLKKVYAPDERFYRAA